MVMAWVDVKRGSEIIASTGSGRRLSRTVGTHVANTITKWMEHLPHLRDRQPDQVRTSEGTFSRTGREPSSTAPGRIL